MKVLVVRLSSFGDQIHVCPAVTDLKKQRPDCEIHWLVQSEFAAVPQLHTSVSKVYFLPLRSIRENPLRFSHWKQFFRLLNQLRAENYDVSVDVQGMLKSAVMSFFSGAKLRLGYARDGLAEQGAFWFYKKHFRRQRGISSVRQLREFFKWAFQLQPLSDSIDYGLNKPLTSNRSNTVLFVPFASHPSKMLSMESWLSLACALHKEDDQLRIKVSWGSGSESSKAASFFMNYSDYIAPTERKFEFDQLIKSLLGYRFVVGLDTGITHLANALGVPTIMIFKASSPMFFFTPGSDKAIYLGSLQLPPSQTELEDSALTLLRATVKSMHVANLETNAQAIQSGEKSTSSGHWPS